MTSRDFCYWLQGYFEIGNFNSSGLGTGPRDMSKVQVEVIQRHLAMVFKHEIDPSFGDQEKQAALNAIHQPPPPSEPGFQYEPCIRC